MCGRTDAVYEGEKKGGLMHGFGVVRHANGRALVGRFNEGTYVGAGACFLANRALGFPDGSEAYALQCSRFCPCVTCQYRGSICQEKITDFFDPKKAPEPVVCIWMNRE